MFADYLAPDVAEAHASAVLPLVAATCDSSPGVCERALYGVDAWLSLLDEGQLTPYLHAVLEALLRVLDGHATPPKIVETALGCLASCAETAGASLHPFLPALLPRLTTRLGAAGDEHLVSRARALEVLSALLAAPGGRAGALRLLPDAMAAADAGFGLEYTELREAGLGVFAAAAAAAGPELAPWLPGCVGRALASLQLDDGELVDTDTESEGGGEENAGEAARRAAHADALSRGAPPPPPSPPATAGADSDSDDDERDFRVRTGVLGEKAAACAALGEFAHHCGAAFVPHLSEAMPHLQRMAGYFHEDVRGAAYEAIGQCVACAAASRSPLPPQAFADVVSLLAKHATEEDDPGAASSAMEAAARVLRSAPPGSAPGNPLLAKPISQLSGVALAVLTKTARCQRSGDDSDDDAGGGGGGGGAGAHGGSHGGSHPQEPSPDDDDGEAAEEWLLSGVGELLPALAHALGSHHFGALFGPHFAALLKRGAHSAPPGEREEVMGALAQVCDQLGEAAAPCLPLAMPLALREMASPAPLNRRNAAFLAGVLAAAGGPGAAPFASHVAAALLRLLADTAEDGGVADNACGAAAKLMRNAQAGVGTAERGALLRALVAAAPIREDFEEAPHIFGCLCSLLRAGDEAIGPIVPDVLRLFAAFAASEPPHEAAGKAARSAAVAEVGATMKGLMASPLAAQLTPLLQSLPPANLAALSSAAAAAP